jgi:hypothetical protein
MLQREEIQISHPHFIGSNMSEVSEYAMIFPKKFLIRYAVESEAFNHTCEEKERKTEV